MSIVNKEEKAKDVIKLFTDADVEAELKILKSIDPDEMNDIYRKYSDTLMSIIATAAEQTDEEKDIVQLEQIKRIMNLAPMEERFIRSKDKVWNVRDHILNKNADYFLNKDYSTLIKKDHNQVILERIIDIIKDRFSALNEDHQNFYWKKATILLNCVARYKKLYQNT